MNRKEYYQSVILILKYILGTKIFYLQPKETTEYTFTIFITKTWILMLFIAYYWILSGEKKKDVYNLLYNLYFNGQHHQNKQTTQGSPVIYSHIQIKLISIQSFPFSLFFYVISFLSLVPMHGSLTLL